MSRSTWLRRVSSLWVTTVMAGFGLTGIASAQTITNTGPGSTNTISSNSTNNCSVTNRNNVHVSNSNYQSAVSGSANESGNTSTSWAGWSALDPAAAQADGTAYSSWWSGVVNWIGQRAGGNGWNSTQSNLNWAPSSANWSGYDPMIWQANGQSFANWYNGVESYLNSNNSAWLLGWPADATGSGNFGSASSGNATNNYNANFSININNAARAAAGTNACGQSNFTPPPVSGGMGGGPSGGQGSVSLGSPATHTFVPSGGMGGSGSFGGGGLVTASSPSHGATPLQVVANTPVAPVTPSQPTGGSGGGGVPATGSAISNTGPGSSNTISSNVTDNSSVTNTNTVVICNTSSQTATTGSSNVSGNTSTGGAGSGDASNASGSGTGVGITN